jgi:hypothetical protein
VRDAFPVGDPGRCVQHPEPIAVERVVDEADDVPREGMVTGYDDPRVGRE